MWKRPALAPSLLIMFIGLMVLLRGPSTVHRIIACMAIAGGALVLLAGEVGARRKQ